MDAPSHYQKELSTVTTSVSQSRGIQRTYEFLVYLFTFSIPFSIRINAYLTVACAICFVVYAVATKNAGKGLFKMPLFLLVMLQLLIMLLGLTHSADVSQGYMEIERFFYAGAVIILVFKARETNVTITNLVMSFAAGCLLLSLYGLIWSLATENELRWHERFSETIHVHPTYFTIYLVFIFFFFAELLRFGIKSYSATQKAVVISLLVYITILVVFVRSQLGLLIFAVVALMYPVIVYKKRAAVLTFILFTVALVVYFFDSARAATFFDSYGTNVSGALGDRFKLWGGAMEAISLKPVFGAGTGGEQLLLNEGYQRTGYEAGIANSYNAHNQYLEFLVRNGIFDLLCFLTLLIYSFRESLRKSNYLFLIFNMMFVLSMIAESSLNVHKGIVFFYFFLASCVFLPFSKSRGIASER